LLPVRIPGMLNTGMIALQHMKADQKDQQAAGNAKRGQCDAEQIEYQFTRRAENQNNDKTQEQRLACNGPFYLHAVIGGQAEKNRRIGNGVHNGKKPHEHR